MNRTCRKCHACKPIDDFYRCGCSSGSCGSAIRNPKCENGFYTFCRVCYSTLHSGGRGVWRASKAPSSEPVTISSVVVTLTVGDRQYSYGVDRDAFPDKQRFLCAISALGRTMKNSTRLALEGLPIPGSTA